ncbi:MAG: hypothetical protein ABSC25_11920 [Roseiarcus sp.]|jgi:hypothetical protein
MGSDQAKLRETLAFKNSNKAWVIKELDALIREWRAWQREVDQLGDDPYNPLDPKPGRVFADGEENTRNHSILQAKTLEFLETSIAGHGFICGRDGTKIDRTDLRLKIRVKHRIYDLDELRACLQYAVQDTQANLQQGTTTAEQRPEVVFLKPGIWGMSIDVKEAWRRIRAWYAGP